MVKAEIEIASVKATWNYAFLPPSLPSPGSEPFSFLIKELRPFGVTARSFDLQAPSSNLDDVSVTIIIPNPEMKIVFGYSKVEFEVFNFGFEDIANIMAVMNLSFETLSKIDPDYIRGIGTSRLILNLKFLNRVVNDYLAEKFAVTLNGKSYSPDWFSVNLSSDDLLGPFGAKIVVSPSLAIENGLFLDIQHRVDTNEPNTMIEHPAQFFVSVGQHFQGAFSLLDIEVPEEENGSNV